MFEHQFLNLCQHRTEQVRHRQPQIDGDIPREPLREGALETVPHGDGKGYRSQNGEDNQEECPKRVDEQGGSGEKKFQELPYHIAKPFLEIVHTAFHIHTRHRRHIRGRDTEFIQFLVELFVTHQIGCFGIPHHRLVFQLVPQLAVFVHAEGLLFEHFVCPLHDGTEHPVDSLQHHRKEEDTETERKGTEQRIDVDGFGTSQGLPYPECHIKERPQARNAFGDTYHVTTHRHHLRVKRTEDLVQAVKFRSHDYQYLSLSVP